MLASTANSSITHSVVIHPASRPIAPRQRSNSLPVIALCVSGQDASLLISTAEKAIARRSRHRRGARSMESLESVATSISPPPLSNIPSYTGHSEANTTETNLVPELTIASPTSAPIHANEPKKDHTRRFPRTVDGLEVMGLARKPNRQAQRTVPSRRLKDYADGLFLFTQGKLNATIPSVPTDLLPLLPGIQLNEQSLPVPALLSPPRPDLKSHFSDWTESLSSSSPSHSPNEHPSTPPNSSPASSPLLLSPDSFFDTSIHTPTTINPIFPSPSSNRPPTLTRGSSPTFDPSALTPPSTTTAHATRPASSYFAGFEHVQADAALDALVLNLGTPSPGPPPNVVSGPTMVETGGRSGNALERAGPRRRSTGACAGGQSLDRGRKRGWLVGTIG